jgi:hypothetical protein
MTVRFDRLVSRRQPNLPVWLQPQLASALITSFRQSRSKRDFMRFLDSFQSRLYSHLLPQYRDETFCQLLTLKLCNLAAGKFHFLNRHSILVSKPYQLTVDPANV